jgi:hypothetical protein
MEKIDYQNPVKKFSLISMLAQHIIIEFFILYIYIYIYMKSIFINYGLLQGFGYFLKSPLYYNNSKNILKTHIM